MSTPNADRRDHQLSRRGLLSGALTAAIAGLVSAACSDFAGDRAGASVPEPATALARDPAARPSATAATASATATPRPPGPIRAAPIHPVGAAGHAPVKRVEYHQPVFRLHDYVRLTPGAKRFPSDSIMLTIDDGPDPEWTPKILRLLEKQDVLATFCMIGCEAKASPRLARAVASQGHHLANHTYTHPLSLPYLSLHRIRKEIDTAQDAIAHATGVVPQVFRSPGGNWGANLYRELGYHGLVPLDWDVDPRDWSLPGTYHIEQAMLAARPGDIVLCHDGGGDRSETYHALRTVIPQLKARGLKFVTLPERT